MAKRSGKMHRVMKEYQQGKLHSGSKTGPKVKSRRQAVAIGMSEARKAGEGKPPKEARSAASRRRRLAKTAI